MGCKLTAVPVPRSQVLDRPYLGGLNLPILVAAGRADRSTQKNSRRLASGHLTTVAKQFRDARRKAALTRILGPILRPVTPSVIPAEALFPTESTKYTGWTRDFAPRRLHIRAADWPKVLFEAARSQK